ncbi:putative aflatoxin biosynthesis ketoreductase nor-1 protein [Phaeoacremonium minimum UCRPA7]|uniref:Putative aflatoxin biosynthesis ketoreductase nor-1 protein n=1 Tax=Phaeoacremonium minimum (strain UCR-PA7) TaxID=1286976 RepID=R8B8P7_PHAM7|nr:putative aflatoxin biosynthesis ketoreductase nor-1 protein [Phaeoacremonium minimum UCRPA7]EON95676.1 putative aflatoxin biosynthesis ketoreductase nor-1 protein [Phaeoacremonium minimum UCRPA7]
MSTTIVLITGASRGIGKGLLEQYLARPNYTVIAANRNPNDANSQALTRLPKGDGTTLVVIKLDSTVKSDAVEAVKQLKAKGIDHVDVVIANAAISYIYGKVAELDTEDMHKHAIVNNYAVIWLFQALIPLLKKAVQPKFIGIGSSAGVLT